MAEETEVASATVTADVTPWERAFVRAGEITDGWSKRTETTFSSIAATVAQKTAGITSTVAALAEGGLTGGELGGSIGQTLGSVVGTALGGPAGTFIGRALGGAIGRELGNAFDVGPAIAALADLSPAVSAAVEGVKSKWGTIKGDAAETWDEVLEIVRGVKLGDLIYGDAGQAWERVQQAADQVWQKIDGLINRSLANIADAIDGVWAAVQEPLARLATQAQAFLVKLGLLESGTEDWGDAIRGIEDVGRKVLGSLAYGLGYVYGLFVKGSGYITEYITSPMIKAISLILEGYSTIFGAIRTATEGTFLEEYANRASKALETISEATKKLSDSAAEAGRKAQGVNAEDVANAAREGVIGPGGRIDMGRADNAARQKAAEEAPAAAAAGPVAAAVSAVTDRLASALTAGSREAANAIAQARGGGMADPAARAAEAGEEAVAVMRDVRDGIRDLNRKLDDSPVVRTA